MSKLWSLLTTSFNLRTLVLLLGLGLLLSSWRPIQPVLETALFQLGASLMEPDKAQLRIGIVELSPDEMLQLTSGAFDLSLSEPSSSLANFNQLLASTSAPIGVVLRSPVRWHDDGALTLLRQVPIKQKSPTQQQRAIGKFLRQRQTLKQHLTKPDTLILGLVQTACQTAELSGMPLVHPINREAGKMASYFGVLPRWLQPSPPTLLVSPPNTGVQDQIQYLPLANCRNLSQPLLWNLRQQPTPPDIASEPSIKATQLSTKDVVVTDFVLAMYLVFSQQKSATWSTYSHLSLGSLRFPLSPDGGFIPFSTDAVTDSALNESNVMHFKLGQQRGVQQSEILILGEHGDPALTKVALSLQALEHQTYLYTPAISYWLNKLLLIVLAAYLVFVLPKISAVVGTLLSSLVATGLLVAQIGWQITQWMWLPLYEPLCYLLLGHLLMLIWLAQHRRHQNLLNAANTAHYQLGLQLYRDGRSDDALQVIRDTTTSVQLLELLYDIGAQFERKRLYAEAVQTYQALAARKHHYRDTAEKITRLMALQQSNSGDFGNNLTMTKTLVLADAKVNKPVLGRYEIEKEIGRGAMGVVYLGRDPKIARHVAIKTLNYAQFDAAQLPELKERFYREAEAAGRLNHPNIVTIYDVGEERDLAFIAMDYLEGKPLNEFIHIPALLPIARVYRIMAEVADALHFAHSKHIVHRDVKPANIIYNESNGQVTVTDFGIARITDDSRTRTGDVMGSPLYMSPEQLKGHKVGHSADIFSLGVTMYQLLTGKLPFNGDNLANLTYMIINEDHKGPREWRSDLPTSATRIINKALQKDPAKRYDSAKDMCDAIRKSLENNFGITIDD